MHFFKIYQVDTLKNQKALKNGPKSCKYMVICGGWGFGQSESRGAILQVDKVNL